MRSFRSKLYTAFAILILLIALPLALAWRGLAISSSYSERASRANEVLAAHLVLSERGQRLLRHVQSAEARPGDTSELRIRAEVATEITRARRAITDEVAMIGKGGAVEEVEELARLDAINQSLMRAAANEDDRAWRQLVQAAVAEEQRELDVISRARQRIDRAVRTGLFAAAISAMLIGGLLLFWLQRQVKSPLDGLLIGTQALINGKLDHRIGSKSVDEFGQLAASFDQMASVLERQTQQIAQARDNLEMKVASRTEALEEANTLLTEAADRRRRFLADISHELRTPLAIIRGEAEVTMRGKAGVAALKNALGRIADQALGMGRLVDDLLFVARTEAGEPKLRLATVRLGDLLEHAVTDVRPMLEADGGRIGYSSDSSDVRVAADPDRIRQLILILIDNAIRYSVGAPDIEVHLHDAPGGAVFRVKDKGIGIALSDLPHIFDRYRRGKQAQSQNENGAGLGLPLAKSIVEAHGGTITVDSTENKGTTVTVQLAGRNGSLKAVA